ncbi:DUF3422 domain-containing protein [Notoacmeibacter sp. MSK16QG-6]|nr:DUF3422 domain-containing protein [Notoacmeibacter sp. MSK16QG-6]MCP1198529.1 DUF3422 domain-containing protein [Notoacmeibacter sp. MSK16QG-6]
MESGATVAGFPAYHLRHEAIGEVHSRPNPVVETPSIIKAIAFMADGGKGIAWSALASQCRALGASVPDRSVRHYAIDLPHGELRWERHAEFATYLWHAPLRPNTGTPLGESPFGRSFSAPGTVISAVHLEIHLRNAKNEKLIEPFDPNTLCHSLVEKGKASAITDFRQDAEGYTHILVLHDGLSPSRAGVLAQRLIEIEFYRTLAMLALPLAQQLSPRIAEVESDLADIADHMRAGGPRDAEQLLATVTDLAADLEADATSSVYRFGAARAYNGIVEERLKSLGEVPVSGSESWTAFLERRLAPAMRTVRSVEERQSNMSRKLNRASALIRSWVDIDLQRQNAGLLTSMNRRTAAQLRLQQTVEGLSIAAISYYVVGLIGYLAKGLDPLGASVDPAYVTAFSVPVVVLVVAAIVWRIRRSHGDSDH